MRIFSQTAASREREGSASVAVTGAITGSAILLFVAIGGAALGGSARSSSGHAGLLDQMLLVALFCNIALILVGWRRYRRLLEEVVSRTAAEARARDMASRDPLTGFLNRRTLSEEGAAMVVGAQQQRKAVALLMVDLDHFKSVNDTHGHAVGDALLRRVAGEIAAIVPQDALTARLGGDEFACAFLFEPAAPESVDQIAERLVARMGAPFAVEGHQVRIAASVGIARSDEDCASIDALVRTADIAMYAAKGGGRGRHAWFDASMERELQARHEIEKDLRDAIPGGQIVPYFEQQIDLRTGRVVGFEVLARWQHPTRGVISPDGFISVAEQTGMIAEMSLSIMRQAFAAARDWDGSLTLSVNISPWQLKDPWLAQKIIKLLTETGFPASRLEIEITESALFDNLPLAHSIVGSLKNQGVGLALDDFGTGYSSLAHLRALPFDRIKIDRSFIGSIVDDPDSTAIVGAIVGLGESLNLPITAEGIEDAAIEDRLRAMRCARGQGYLYGRPLSIANVRRLLAERRLLTSGLPMQETVATLRRVS